MARMSGDLLGRHCPPLLHPGQRVARREPHEDEHQHHGDREGDERLRDRAEQPPRHVRSRELASARARSTSYSGRIVTDRNRRFTPNTIGLRVEEGGRSVLLHPSEECVPRLAVGAGRERSRAAAGSRRPGRSSRPTLPRSAARPAVGEVRWAKGPVAPRRSRCRTHLCPGAPARPGVPPGPPPSRPRPAAAVPVRSSAMRPRVRLVVVTSIFSERGRPARSSRTPSPSRSTQPRPARRRLAADRSWRSGLGVP